MPSESLDKTPLNEKRLTLTERFEKTRIALLSYAALSVIMSVSSITNKGTKVPSVSYSGISIDTLSLSGLFWLVSLVYLFVFVKYELPALDGINREIFRGADLSELQSRIARLGDKIEGAWEDSKGSIHELEGQTRNARAQMAATFDHINSFSNSYDEIGSRLSILSRELKGNAYANLSQTIESTTNHLNQVIEASKRQINSLKLIDDGLNKIKSIPDEKLLLTDPLMSSIADGLNNNISIIQRQFTNINSALTETELSRLKIWDKRAPILLWIFATFAFISAFVASVLGFYILSLTEAAYRLGAFIHSI
ncbi:hypothetical protein [Sphingomonas aurantiaca]|uniref:hypothetical protein n=1 Tax=Sphingomonas aurantiaca TaxID=185949 RepID=UPI00334E722C